MEHQDDADIDEPYDPEAAHTSGTVSTPAAPPVAVGAGASAGDGDGAGTAPPADAVPAVASTSTAVAKSIRCVDTGKVFRTMMEAQAYAERTGNANFEECAEEKKALTPEEKAIMMEKMSAKLKEKKVRRTHLRVARRVAQFVGCALTFRLFVPLLAGLLLPVRCLCAYVLSSSFCFAFICVFSLKACTIIHRYGRMLNQAAREEDERTEKIAKEKIRRKSGKDVGQLKQEHKAREAMKEAAQRKKDKAADKAQLQRM